MPKIVRCWGDQCGEAIDMIGQTLDRINAQSFQLTMQAQSCNDNDMLLYEPLAHTTMYVHCSEDFTYFTLFTL